MMNERIRRLAEQVYGTQATEQEIKFAELIVRECAGLCSDPVAVLQHWGIDYESK